MEKENKRVLNEKQSFQRTHRKPLMFSCVLVFISALLLISCTKNGDITVTTKSVTDITEHSAKSGGSVTSSGYFISECGVCYSTTPNPTINDSHTEDHSGTGSFNSTLSGLNKGTKYYVRAYANTSSGIKYGNEVSFSTNIEYTINVSANPITGGSVSGGGSYKQGHNCTLTATANSHYTFTNWTENGNVVSTNANYSFPVNGSRTIMANFNYNISAPTGAINGLFSVSATKQVWFSKGNLQYQASTNTWRFATRQYDCIGEDNKNISSTYNGWIDLFGWGTSGYNHGAMCYQPWSISWQSTDYYVYGDYIYNLYNQTGRADWGYNAISNGGNTCNKWRTLTESEWEYLIKKRETTSGILFAVAEVDGVNGIVLLPDDWDTNYYTFNKVNTASDYSFNIITATKWNSLEQYGAIFLPAAGERSSDHMLLGDRFGSYWSASSKDENHSYYVSFNYAAFILSTTFRYGGCSVRLVCNAN